MRQRMITLCDETWKIASDMGNFSSWVRSKLREHLQQDRPDKEIMHRKCGNFVTAKWSKLDQLYWGHCEHCNEVLEWKK